jgi:DNA topoisomerase-1
MAGSPATNGHVNPGISIRFGPVEDKDVKMEDGEGDALVAAKRKSRSSVGEKKSYAEAESSEEDEPLVRLSPLRDDLSSPCDHTVALG